MFYNIEQNLVRNFDKTVNRVVDNLEFINTHPNLVGFLMGLVISLEENHEDRDLIKGLKLALFGPISGIGDAIFWFTFLPIIAGISSGSGRTTFTIGLMRW